MFISDLKYAWRGLVRNPMIMIIIIVSLAAVIGPCAALFGITEQFFFSGSAQYLPKSLMELYVKYPDSASRSLLYKEYDFLRRNSNNFSEIMATARIGGILNLNGAKEISFLEAVSSNYFSVLMSNVAPGRKFTPADDFHQNEIPVIISHSLWQRRFDNSSDIIGRSFILGSRPVVIIGVAERGFRGIGKVATTEIWVPMECWYAPSEYKNEMQIEVYGMPRAATVAPQVEDELRIVSERLNELYPGANNKYEIMYTSARNEKMRLAYFVRATIFFLSMTVLIVAWVNVCTLLLARTAGRRKEIALRISAGAGRFQLFRLFFIEGLFIAIAVFGLSVLFAYFLINAAPVLLNSPVFPVTIKFSLNYSILAYAMLLALLTIILFVLFPMKQTSEKSVIDTLKSDYPVINKKSRISGFALLFVVQISVIHALLSGGGALLSNYYNTIQKTNMGFDSGKTLLLFSIVPQIGDNNNMREVDYAGLAEHVLTVPGVRNAAYIDQMPLDLSGSFMKYYVESGIGAGGGNISREIGVARIGAGYFEVFGTTILQGSGFKGSENENRQAAVINRCLAELAYPDISDPDEIIGRYLKTRDNGNIRIVGIAENGKYGETREAQKPFMYVMAPGISGQSWTLAVEAHAKQSKHLVNDVRKLIDKAEPLSFVYSVKTLQEHLKEAEFANVIAVRLMIGIGGIALFIASIGLAGFVAFWVRKSSRAIGIRMALGASPAAIVKYMELRFLTPVFIGILIGTIVTWRVSQLISGFAFKINSMDAAGYLLSALFIILTTFIVVLIPAIKAGMVNPNVVLRKEE
ncbi:MAG: ABC transporter permease [Acidobacteriota bacterium]|jgi:predicted permease|nr:ABC transporter permease [Acidobacteriota bacterium]